MVRISSHCIHWFYKALLPITRAQQSYNKYLRSTLNTYKTLYFTRCVDFHTEPQEHCPSCTKKRRYCIKLLNFAHGALSLQSQLQVLCIWIRLEALRLWTTNELPPPPLALRVCFITCNLCSSDGSPLSHCVAGPCSSFDTPEEPA